MPKTSYRVTSINCRTTEDIKRLLDWLTVREGRSQGQVIDIALRLLAGTWGPDHDAHSCSLPDGCQCGCRGCERLIVAGLHKRGPARPRHEPRKSLSEMVKEAQY